MKLVAKQKFTDQNGTTRNVGDQFEVQNDQEAQQYIRQGQAEADKSDKQSQSQR